MANQKLNKAREMLVNKYIDSLKQDKIPWHMDWVTTPIKLPINAITKKEYNGVNQLLLSFIAMEKGYISNQWCTFNQIADKEEKYHKGETWTLKKGSKSVPIEYWYVYDTLTKKKCTFDEYEKIAKEDINREKDFRICSKTYLVFNADCIDGIKKEKESDNSSINKKEINKSEFVNKIIRNMKVSYLEEGQRAYYNSNTDTVVIPNIEKFKTDYGYYATQLHELCHATGHESRLNRDLKNPFGSMEYAKEELRAEISSSFLMQELKLNYEENHINNHIAYIQSWIEVLQKDPNELFRAIKDSEKIVSYIKEIENMHEQNKIFENEEEEEL